MRWTLSSRPRASDGQQGAFRGCTPLILCVLLAATLLLLRATPAHAAQNAPPRNILVLYNSGQGQTASMNIFAEGFQLVANYFGLLPEYRDVAQRPLPDDSEMQRYRFVVSAFGADAMSQPVEYLHWLLEQFDAGRKVLVLGRLGATKDANEELVDPQLVARVYERLGFAYNRAAMQEMARLRYTYVDQEVMGFERPLPPLPRAYVDMDLLEQAGPDAPGPQEMRVLVRVRRASEEGDGAPQVAYGPNGGIALTEYLYWMDQVSFRKRWYVDPFTFFPAALGIQNEPVLTPTTQNGVRVAFSHVDGDAFMGFTEFSHQKVCAEILRDEIFTVYALPFTLSVIVAEVGPEYRGSQRSMNLAREIFALDNVEPASHTFSHPYVWNKEDRKEFEDDLPALHGIPVEGYTFDAKTEIVASCRYITENLAPPDKPCNLLLWSGNCEPSADQIALADENDILNINGGDSVKNENTSLFRVSGLYRWVRGRYQIFTGQANENILTNLWTGPFYGFRNTVQTMEATGSPRRLMPVNPYYHFYSGEKYAAVQALKDVYDWMLEQELSHIYASRYVRMVEGFIHAKKARRQDGDGWEFSDYGLCASVRFPADAPAPDLARCENVLGWSRQEQGLFVHLEPYADKAVLRLSGSLDGHADRPFVDKAAGLVTDYVAEPGKVSLTFDCFWDTGWLALAGLVPNSAYAVSGTSAASGSHQSDAGGRLLLENLQSGTLELQRQ